MRVQQGAERVTNKSTQRVMTAQTEGMVKRQQGLMNAIRVVLTCARVPLRMAAEDLAIERACLNGGKSPHSGGHPQMI